MNRIILQIVVIMRMQALGIISSAAASRLGTPLFEELDILMKKEDKNAIDASLELIEEMFSYKKQSVYNIG
ncbi:MAG: hypothetical protein WCO48_00765 [Candidatus Taylorbacteria bacterium]